MIDAGDLYHSTSSELRAAGGSGWSKVGENVGRGGTATSLHSAFMNSPTHAANVLGTYNYVGIGTGSSDGRLYVTVVFMQKGSTPSPTTTQPAQTTTTSPETTTTTSAHPGAHDHITRNDDHDRGPSRDTPNHHGSHDDHHNARYDSHPRRWAGQGGDSGRELRGGHPLRADLPRLELRDRLRERANARVTYRSLLRTSPSGRFSNLPLGRLHRRTYANRRADSTTLFWVL